MEGTAGGTIRLSKKVAPTGIGGRAGAPVSRRQGLLEVTPTEVLSGMPWRKGPKAGFGSSNRDSSQGQGNSGGS